MTAAPHRVHLVGSLNTATAEESFTLASTLITGDRPRVPDGEVGQRFNWLNFQGDHLEDTIGLERIPGPRQEFGGFDARPVQLDGSVPIEDLMIGNLGYADAAIDSYRHFVRFKQAGSFKPETRFQVSLPTPLAVVSSYVVAGQQQALLPKYEIAMVAEISRILSVIPEAELAIQFDVAVEFIYIEGVRLGKYDGQNPWFGDSFNDAVRLLAPLINTVPDAVQVGIHLCYGDINEQHFTQPHDTGNIVKFVNLLLPQLTRDLTWVHLPVPIDRLDDAYYQPLTGLGLDSSTEIFLGLIHREDGVDGIAARSAVAQKYVPVFGIGAECGFGRGPVAEREKLFRLHA